MIAVAIIMCMWQPVRQWCDMACCIREMSALVRACVINTVYSHAMWCVVMSQELEQRMEKEHLRGKTVTLKLKVGVWIWNRSVRSYITLSCKLKFKNEICM